MSARVSQRGYRVAAIDLPGFGDAADNGDYTVEGMSNGVVEVIRALRATGTDAEETDAPWLLGGHSMGGKVAAVVARRAADDDAGLGGLRGLFLVSPSPPGPEPMPGDKREQLLKSLGASSGNEAKDRARAHAFVKDNTGKLALPQAHEALAEDDLLRMNRAAFVHWLTEGSREDWAARVSVLPFPVLILAGSEDAALGPETQQKQTLPHFRTGELVTMRGAGHLAPLERAGEVALRMEAFAAQIGVRPASESLGSLGSSFRNLLDGPKTSPQTRAALQARLELSVDTIPQVFTGEEFLLLRALAECVVPGAPANLAARVDQSLAFGMGDGWRYAALPVDREAWVKGLHSLDLASERHHGVPFLALPGEDQQALLMQACAGSLGKGLLRAAGLGESSDTYNAEEMKQWFEEVRGEFTRLYISDPRTMERVGFRGFADEAGFTQIRLGELEEFER